MKFKRFLVVSLTLITLFSFAGVSFAGKKSSKKAAAVKSIKAKVKLVKGKAFIKVGKKWRTLKMGTVLTKEKLLKVAKGSVVKMKTSNGKLLVVKGKKIVKMASLFAETAKKKSMNSLISKMGKGKAKNEFGATAVAGVRGADVSKQKKKVKKEELNWEKK